MTNWKAPFRRSSVSHAPNLAHSKRDNEAASRPINAAITIPGSKSVTNRALILAALADSPSTLIRPLRSRDTELMVSALRALGIEIESIEIESTEIESVEIENIEIADPGGDRAWRITPAPLYGPASIDVGNAGTVMRFMLPVAALATGLINFDGDPRSHERPVGPLVRALEELGVTIDHKDRYSLPLLINGSGQIAGGEVSIDASKSSQFLSALLLAGPKMKSGLTVRDIGPSLPSQPHIEMTIQMLRDFGAIVDVQPKSWKVQPGGLVGREFVIEPDLSNAAPFMAAPIICGGEVLIRDWPRNTTQPGDRLREIFTEMGGHIQLLPEGLKVTGTGRIEGIDIDLHDEGELTPSIAALAALAQSPSHLRGIGHLRLHETDRLAALAREINALGGDVIEESDALRINPVPASRFIEIAQDRAAAKSLFHTYEDHRLATAGAILGLAIPEVVVENIETTRKTLSDFPGLWSSLLER